VLVTKVHQIFFLQCGKDRKW